MWLCGWLSGWVGGWVIGPAGLPLAVVPCKVVSLQTRLRWTDCACQCERTHCSCSQRQGSMRPALVA